MLRKIRKRLTYANVMSTIACFAFLATGTAYAANTIGTNDIIDGEVKNADIGTEAVTTGKIRDGGIRNVDLGADSVVGSKIAADAVGSSEVANESLTSSDLATDSVNATEVADNSIDAGEIVDFGLSNQDVGVLFAEVDAAGVLSNSSGGVTATKLGGSGNYDVDFGLSIVNCTSVATIGPATTGSAAGEINVADRSGNNEAVFVDTNASDGSAADKPFRLVVVC